MGQSLPALPADLMEALRGAMTPKFLATVGPDGEPNVVPIISIQPWKEGELAFGEYLMFKTRRNLLANPKVAVAVVTEKLDAWTLRGTFQGFETSGAMVDAVNRSELLRYNAYTGIRAAGSIRVEALDETLSFSKREVLLGWLHGLPLRRALHTRRTTHAKMPLPVEEKFTRLQALRVMAFVGRDGFPHVIPMLSCFAAGPNRLVISDRKVLAHRVGLEGANRVAVSVLTFDPIAYQVKGTWAGTRAGAGVVEVTAVYSASPPKVGERLDPVERAAG